MVVTVALKVAAPGGDCFWVIVWQFQKNLNLVCFTGKGQVLSDSPGSPYHNVIKQVPFRRVRSHITTILFMFLKIFN